MESSLRRSFRIGLFLSSLVTALAATQAGLSRDAYAAADEKVKVAVGAFDGAKSGDARSAFIEALKKDGSYEVTDAEDVKGSSKAAAIAEAAKGLGVDVVITGKFSKGGLKLKVFGADGKALGDAEIKGAGGKLKSAIAQDGASSVADDIAKVAGKKKKEEKKDEEAKPAEEEDKPEEESKTEASVSTSDLSGGGGLSPFDITAGLRPLHRTFAFHQTAADVRPNDGFGQFLKYELPLGPVLFVDLNWFPASHAMTGPAEWFGITAGFEKGFATSSVYQEGVQGQEKTLKTNEMAYYAGARFRLPIGDHMLGATGTFGQHTFALDGDSDKPLVPDVKYTYVKAGLNGTLRFGDIFVGANVGKRFVMSTGALKTVWFPNVKTQSLEAGVNVGYRLVSTVDLVAGFDWLRYAFDFNPVPRRATLESYVAGGATDEYMSGYIAFRFHLPGKAESDAATAAASQ